MQSAASGKLKPGNVGGMNKQSFVSAPTAKSHSRSDMRLHGTAVAGNKSWPLSPLEGSLTLP
ncbi:hypothetical protein SRABI05_01252 [Agrobacterium fabrum]|nr:hypothetical protein SRABI46_00354 [Agrobacterium fabrum]CAH0180643.1 hypothetical protein SRABI05_01252 [Agrobacterium fabrum]